MRILQPARATPAWRAYALPAFDTYPDVPIRLLAAEPLQSGLAETHRYWGVELVDRQTVIMDGDLFN
jgi:hypothetical protein